MIQEVTYAEVAGTILRQNPGLAKAINSLALGKKHRIYRVRYPYGSNLLIRGVLQIPVSHDEIVPIHDKRIPRQIQKDLNAYGTIPLGMVSHNSVELYQQFGDRDCPFSRVGQGKILGLWVMHKDQYSEYTKSLWNMSSGVRSCFILPRISDGRSLKRLSKHFGVETDHVKELPMHWSVIKKIAQHEEGDKWYSEIIFFSDAWRDSLLNVSWRELKNFLYDVYYKSTLGLRILTAFQSEFSNALRLTNLQPNPYVIETVKHLYSIAFGISVGHVLASDEITMPLEMIQRALMGVYKLEFSPSLFTLGYFNLQNPQAIYYSLNYTLLPIEIPDSNASVNNAVKLANIQRLMDSVLKKIAYSYQDGEPKFIQDMEESVNTDFIHASHLQGQESFIEPSQVVNVDEQIKEEVARFGKPFCEKNSFMSGCVRFSPNL